MEQVHIVNPKESVNLFAEAFKQTYNREKEEMDNSIDYLLGVLQELEEK